LTSPHHASGNLTALPRQLDQPLSSFISLDFPGFAGFFASGRVYLPVHLPGLGRNHAAGIQRKDAKYAKQILNTKMLE